MTQIELRSLAERAKRLYAESLGRRLELECPDMYVAIEPDSGDYFTESTFGEAVSSARGRHPDKQSFVLRIGRPTAIELGAPTL